MYRSELIRLLELISANHPFLNCRTYETKMPVLLNAIN
jgi:hypothetical protein